MIKISQKSLTPEELKKLQSAIPGFWKRIEGFVIKLLFVFMFSIIPVLFIDEMLKLELTSNGIFAFSWTLVSIVIALLLTWREEKFVNRNLIISELEEGVGNLVSCKIEKGFIAEVPKSGIFHFLKVAENQTLIINDRVHDLFKLAPDTFPSSDFEIIVSPKSNYILGLNINGKFVQPEPSLLIDELLPKKLRKINFSIEDNSTEKLVSIEEV